MASPTNSTLETTTKNLNTTGNNNFFSDSFDFANNPGLVFVTIACGITGIWILYLSFYNSRLTAFIVKKIILRFFLKDGSLEIGSISFCIISGKCLFRNVKYSTKDYSIQVVDGLLIIRWWNFYKPYRKDENNDLLRNKEELENWKTRLWFQLNGFECHLYNRSDLYKNIQTNLKCERYGDAGKSAQSLDLLNERHKDNLYSEKNQYNLWRELFPVIGLSIRSGKLAIGNRLLEQTLWVHFNKGKFTYSMPDAPCSLDEFTHFFHGKCDDVRLLLSRSPGYAGDESEPPRSRGQDFTVLLSSEARLTYYMDVPGVVPSEDDIKLQSDPMWGLDVNFEKRVEIRYGPWVDMQRDAIQKYFFPSNFQELPVTKPLEPSQTRIHTGFDMNINFFEGSSIELIFTINEETVAIHLVCGDASKGIERCHSSVNVHQPWIINEYGYTTNVSTKLNEVDVTTSLQFQKFLHCENVEIDINMAVPRIWNHYQHWECDIHFTKTTCYFIWQHVDYISELFNEWTFNIPPDISRFVPYQWEFNFYFRDFELVLMVNEFNWIDSMNENENNEIALCGENLDINFTLPYTRFQPLETETKFFFRGETIMLRSFIAESNTLRKSILSLLRNEFNTDNSTSSEGNVFEVFENTVSMDEQLSNGWRNRTGQDAWIDVWSVPIIILNMLYRYHPIPYENDVTKQINEQCGMKDIHETAPLDVCSIELEAGPSAIRLLGHFWRQFIFGFKENYFGLFRDITEFNANRQTSSAKTEEYQSFQDATNAISRPMNINLRIVLLDLHAELMTHASKNEQSPQAVADRLTFEMRKRHEETRIQLILSPVTICFIDDLKRCKDQSHLSRGFISLDGFQFRGHAMFSNKDILHEVPLEYAWLTEVQCANLKVKLTPSQIQSILSFAKSFVLHILDEENQFTIPDPSLPCWHGFKQETCSVSKDSEMCPSEDDVKYKMVRVSVQSINVFIMEAECACNLTTAPVRLAFCNAPNEKTSEGGSLFINEYVVKQYIQVHHPISEKPEVTSLDNWIEVGMIGLGPVTIDIHGSPVNQSCQKQQMYFLKLHDGKTKRLWFLWNTNLNKFDIGCNRYVCGCVGGCDFFGDNFNGVRFFTTELLDASNEKHNDYGSESLLDIVLSVSTSIADSISKRSLSKTRKPSSRSYRKMKSLAGGQPENTTAFEPSNLIDEIVHGGVPRLRSAESESTFYSCNSDTDLLEISRVRITRSSSKNTASKTSLKSSGSTDSFISAISSTNKNYVDKTDFNSIVDPVVLSSYANYMTQVTCLNIKQTACGLWRKFSLLQNLKAYVPPNRKFVSPILPQFDISSKASIPFSTVELSPDEHNTLESHKTGELDKKDKKGKSVVAKFHKKISIIVTPLSLKILERFVDSLVKSDTVHFCHLLDILHFNCIQLSKQKYDEQLVMKAVSDNDFSESTSTNNSVFISLPKTQIFFLQVYDKHISSKTSFVSAKCESDFSSDSEKNIHSKGMQTALLAGVISGINVKISSKKSVDTALIRYSSKLFNESKDKKETLSNYIADKCKDKELSNSLTIFGSIRTIHMQLLHLPSEKGVCFTSIPEIKSKVNFRTIRGTPSHESKIESVGEIVFECGMESLNLSVKSETALLLSQSTPIQKRTDLKDSAPFNVSNEQTDGLMKGKYTLFSNSSSSVSFNSETKAKESSYVSLDIDYGKEHDKVSEKKIVVSREYEQCLSTLHTISGDGSVSKLWINLAAPNYLSPVSKDDEEISLIMVLLPSLNTWIVSVYGILSFMEVLTSQKTKWNYSVLAAMMSGSLPDHGKPLKKNTICSVVTKKAHFLQEEASSQLLNIIRRQTTSHQLSSNIQQALHSAKLEFCSEFLEKGVLALARQWKTVIVGAEVVDNIFASTHEKVKKPVVGRGDLPPDALEFLLKETQESTLIGGDDREGCSTTEEDPLINNSISNNSMEESPNTKRNDFKKEQSLYDWLSKSPVSLPVEHDELQQSVYADSQEKIEKSGRSIHLELLRSQSPMVSVPTSGMQLAEEIDVFDVILAAVGLRQMDFEVKFSTKRCLRGTGQLKALEISVHSKSSDEKNQKPMFLLNGLSCCLNWFKNPTVMERKKMISNEVIFSINVINILQHIDFALVRLAIQISETLDIIRDKRKYLHQVKCEAAKSSTYKSIFPNAEDVQARCWKNMFSVMTLYTMDYSKDVNSTSRKNAELNAGSSKERASLSQSHAVDSGGTADTPHLVENSSKDLPKYNKIPQHFKFNGTACLMKGRIGANMIGVNLTFDLKNLSGSFSRTSSYKEERDLKYDSVTTVHLDRLKMKAVEFAKALNRSLSRSQPELRISRTLLTCKLYASHGIQTCIYKAKKIEHSLFAIGPIAVDIPQHPGALRSTTTQISKRLQIYFLEFDEYRTSKRRFIATNKDTMIGVDKRKSGAAISDVRTCGINFSSILLSAALLPSLRMEYKIEQIKAYGYLGQQSKFSCNLPYHTLSFNTKIKVVPLPPTTHIDLPLIKFEGHYSENEIKCGHERSYLSLSVDIGYLKQNLTTDLLNHMIFFQKGFVQEITEVVEVVETAEQFPIRRADVMDGEKSNSMVFSMKVKLEGIQITATTPSNTGVRLKTSELVIELANQYPTSTKLSLQDDPKIFGQAHVDIIIALGHFNRSNLFNTDEDFTVYANFETSLGVSNVVKEKQYLQLEKETILVSLKRPQIFVMPAGADKGVLVYLHYKNAYENWIEQKKILKTEYNAITEHIFNKRTQQHTTELSSFYILQVTIEGLGVCLPLKSDTSIPSLGLAVTGNHNFADKEPGPAVVVTVSEASVMCCSRESLVSSGQFRDFCLHLSDNFNHMEDRWKIRQEGHMNTYAIPEGSYELCSKTITSVPQEDFQAGKWIVSLIWKMKDGVDIHIDTNIGNRLNLLINALTSLTGDSDVADMLSVVPDIENEGLDYVDFKLNEKARDQIDDNLEKQLMIQTKKLNQLRRNNAPPDVIRREVKQLEDIENALSKDFFKEVKKRFRRKTRRSTMDPSYARRKSAAAERSRFDWNHSVNTNEKMKRSLTVASKSNFIAIGQYNEEENGLLGAHNPSKVRLPENIDQVDGVETSKFQSYEAEALDFEFNMNVDIKSGKCTLHSNSESRESTDFSRLMNRKAFDDNTRQLPNRQLRLLRTSSANTQSNTSTSEQTIFLIPGVKVRLFYSSNCFLSSPQESTGTLSKPTLKKRASLNTSIYIQSLPKEMVVTPFVLEFLEKAFEVMISEIEESSPLDSQPELASDSVLSSGSMLYSFPVDVVVMIRVQPSHIRFNCLPVSKVECLLKIPSLDCTIAFTPPFTSAANSSNANERENNDSGMGFTLCLSSFSFSVFHPYGKHHGIPERRMSDHRRHSRTRNSSISDRKDSLSLTVEFIKFNLSRKILKFTDDQKTLAKISALCDIGSATFSYDMRRLNEILDVPKAWFNRSLMQRLLFGKEVVYATQTSNSQSTKASDVSSSERVFRERKPSGHRRTVSSGVSFLGNLITSPFPSHNVSSRNESIIVQDYARKELIVDEDEVDAIDGKSPDKENEWETKVVIAFNVAKIIVATNLGNIMGQAIWKTYDLATNMNVLLNNVGVSTAAVNLCVREGAIDAHGGVIGGYLEVRNISAKGKFLENFGETPLHSAKIGLKNCEIRLDYMGSSIFMSSLSTLHCKFEDHWLIPGHFSDARRDKKTAGELKSCEIYINCDLTWDELQIIISKSTSIDLERTIIKLQDFFDQQLKSGVRAFNTIQYSKQMSKKSHYFSDSQPEEERIEEPKYQHWIKLMNSLYGLQLNNFPARIPNNNVVLGGRLSLCGNFISVACFNGTNFRSQNWGLFSVRELSLQFTSETRVVENNVVRAACVHDVSFTLGKLNKQKNIDLRNSNVYDFMATIRKVSRGRRNPPVLGASVQDWLIFVNKTNDLISKSTESKMRDLLQESVDKNIEKEISFAPNENESEVIIALPCMHIQLTTEHDQPIVKTTSVFARSIYTENENHKVEMSFLSTFDDAIHVTIDVSLLMYLHSLITSYVREQDVTGGSSRNKYTPESEASNKEKFREFRIKNWKLDPKINFLSWGGKRMDPEIDWLLESLGFKHANMTIPKWIQRGALDPMDYTLAVVMRHLLTNMKVNEDDSK